MGSPKIPPMQFQVQLNEETGMYVARWDDPNGAGITAQAENLDEMRAKIKEAVDAYFGQGGESEPPSAP